MKGGHTGARKKREEEDCEIPAKGEEPEKRNSELKW